MGPVWLFKHIYIKCLWVLLTNVYWFRATGGYICGCGGPSNLVCLRVLAFAGRCTQSGTPQWRSIKKIHDLGNRLKCRSRSKHNRRCTSTSCGHCHTCMIICWKVVAFAGHCTQSGTTPWRSIKKIHVKHDLGNMLNWGKGQNKIGGEILLIWFDWMFYDHLSAHSSWLNWVD